MIKQTENTITTTTLTTTYTASFFSNIQPELEHCFFDGDYCWQSDYENQIDIANVKGEKSPLNLKMFFCTFLWTILCSLFGKVTS